MPSNDLWTQIPDELLNADKLKDKADAFLGQQRKILADTWLKQQQKMMAAVKDQWGQDVYHVTNTGQPPSSLGGPSLRAAQTSPNLLKPSSGVIAPPDMTNPQPPGTPAEELPAENQLITTMREGAAKSGVYLPPLPGAKVDYQKEAELQQTQEQNRTRLGVGPGGLMPLNPNLNPEGWKTQVNPEEPGAAAADIVGGYTGKLAEKVPGIGSLLKPAVEAASRFAVGAEGEGGAMKEIASRSSPELQAAKRAAQEQPLTPILGGRFYSQVEKLINEKIPGKATGQQIYNTLVNNGAKPAELAWTGLTDWLARAKDKIVGKEDLQDFVRTNAVQVQEVVKTPEQALSLGHQEQQGTRYSDYVLPGGSSYRELLLTLPPKPWDTSTLSPAEAARLEELKTRGAAGTLTRDEQNEYTDLAKAQTNRPMKPAPPQPYYTPHWEEPNILAHVRFDERTDPQGKKTLFIQEIQSDWAQRGRKEGFSNNPNLPEGYRIIRVGNHGAFGVVDETGHPAGPLAASEGLARQAYLSERGKSSVPPTPFPKTEDWTKLVMKRMVSWAAENGFDRIAWTTGAQQADRYSLANHVDKLVYDNETGLLNGYQSRHSPAPVFSQTVSSKDLSDYVGQDAAKVLLERGEASGPDLQVGGAGMRGYYDQILPGVANDLGKRHGARVEDTSVASTIGPGKVDLVPVFNPERGDWNVYDPHSQEILDEGLTKDEASHKIEELESSPGRLSEPVHSIAIPQSMKEAALKGQQLFSAAPAALAVTPQQPGESDEQYSTRRTLSGLAAAGMLAERPGFRRFFHGTADGIRKVDPAKFNAKDSFLGPGLYITPHAEAANKWAEGWLPGIVGSEGLNILPIDLPKSTNLLELSEPVDPGMIQKIYNLIPQFVSPERAPRDQQTFLQYLHMNGQYDESKTIETKNLGNVFDSIRSGDLLIAGETLHRAIGRATRPSYDEGLYEVGNKILERAGYDGIEDAHDTIQDPAFPQGQAVLFHSGAKKAQSALAHTTLALRPEATGAVLGGGWQATQDNPNETPEERSARTAEGAVGGAVAGHLLSSGAAGLSIKQVSADAGHQATLDMLTREAPKAVAATDRNLISRISDTYAHAMTDRGVDFANWQKGAQKVIGRPLNEKEMAAELVRLNPDRAALVHLQEGLRPALLAVGDDSTQLASYLIYRHSIDVATQAGEKAGQAVLDKELRGLPAKDQLAALQGRQRMYQRFIAKGDADNDGTVRQHYEPLVAATEQHIQKAQARLATQTLNATQARQIAASAKAKVVAAARKFTAGMDQTEAIRRLDAMEQELGPERFARIESAARQVTDFGRSLLQRKVDAGLLLQDTADELMRRYPNYVPTRYLDYMQDPGKYIPSGKTLSVNDAGIRKLTEEGYGGEQENPLGSMIRNAYQTEALIMKNNAFNAFVHLNEQLPEANRAIRQVTGSYHAKADEKLVSGFRNGVHVQFVMPKSIADIIQEEPLAPIKGLAPLMNIYRTLATAASPAFVAYQVPADSFTYLVREFARSSGDFTQLPKIVSELVKAYGDVFHGLNTRTFRGNTAEFLKGGGGMSGHFGGTVNQARAELKDLSRPQAIQIHGTADAKRIIKDILTLKPVEAVGERFELAPRVASMRLAARGGENAVQGVINGRTVTLDFQQGGAVSKWVNQLIPFFNAGMQGLAFVPRTFRENPRGAFISFLTFLAAPTVVAEAWNNSDEQRRKDYEDVPNYIKNRSIVFMLPLPASYDNKGERHPQYFEFRTRELTPFVSLTREIVNKAMGRDTQPWQDLLTGAITSSSPIQTDSPSGFFGGFVPPVISTGVELGFNKSGQTGAQITSQAADERASAVSKAGAEGIYRGSSAVGLPINARPSQVEYALNDLTGGAGRLARDAGDMIAGQKPDGTPQDVTIAGQFLRKWVGGAVGQRLQSARDERMSPEVEDVLRDLNIYDVSPVPDTIKKLPLGRDEQAIYQKNATELINQAVPWVAHQKWYGSLTTEQKTTLVRNLMTKLREQAANAALEKLDVPALQRRVEAQATATAAR